MRAAQPIGVAIGLAVLLWVCLAGLVPPTASAHSELTGVDVEEVSEGAGRSALVLTLAFGESIDPGFGRMTLVAQDGTRLDVQDVRVTADLRHLQARVTAPPAGTYTLAWFVRSRDGDASNGASEITLGEGGTGTTMLLPPVNARDPAWQPPMTWRMTTVSALVRWLGYVGAALFVGALFFRVLVWPAVEQGEESRSTGKPLSMPGMRALLFAGVSTLLFANVLLLLLQASFLQLTTLQPVDTASPIPLEPSALQQTRTAVALGEIFGTYAGAVWLIRIALIVGLGVTVWRMGPAPSRRGPLLWLALAGGFVLLLTISLSSHAAFVPETRGRAVIAVAIDWTHVIAMSLWLGGLLPLLLGILSLGDTIAGEAACLRMLTRFSALALVAVGILALTGLGSSYVELDSPPLLFRTAYGITLLVKLGVVGLMVSLGGLNRFILVPRVRERGHARRMSRSLSVESALALVLLFSVAMLASQGAAATAWPAHEAMGVAERADVDGASIVLRLVPGTAGDSRVAADVTDTRPGAWRTPGVVTISYGAASDGGHSTNGTSATGQATTPGRGPTEGPWYAVRLTFGNTTTERYLVPGPVSVDSGSHAFDVVLERPGYEPRRARFGVTIEAP